MLIDFFINPAVISIFSIIGAASVILGAVTAAVVYRGRLGERYSLLNHYISELGEQCISRLAWAFNLGLVLCGLSLLPVCLGLGLSIPGVWSKLGMGFGIITALSVSLVGLFPMNKLKGHVIAAFGYFYSGLVTVILFTIAITFQKGTPPVLPRLFSLAGVPAILAYAIFLVYAQVNSTTPEVALTFLTQARPKIAWMALAEWSVFLTTVPWFLVVALGL